MAVMHFYSRRGCHLCEVMLEQLLPMLQGQVEIVVRDIDTRPEWRELYDIRVPVVEYDGHVVSEYPLDAAAITSLLAKLADDAK